jgi:prepilin-type N-terminal cleavage/methylation domain-containing protein
MTMRGPFGGHRRGFTIVEILAASVIMTIFASAFFGIVKVMHASLVRQNVFFDTNRASRYSLGRIGRDVKEAIGLVNTLGVDTTGNTILILGLPSIDGTGEPTDILNDFDFIVYKLNPGDATQLLRIVDVLDGVSLRNGGADGTQVIANNIQNILFSDETGTGLSSAGNLALIKRINVFITTQGTTLGTVQTTQLDADLMMRNKVD